MELYLTLALATTVTALNEKGPPILPIQSVDNEPDKSYVRRAANVDVPLYAGPLQKSNSPEPLAELYKRPDEINHGGVVYTETVDDGYDDKSNKHYAKRSAYEDNPWSSPAPVPVKSVPFKEAVVRAPYRPHGLNGFHSHDDSPRRRFPDSSRRGYTDSPRRRFPDSSRRGYTDSPRRGYTKRDADVDETWSSAGAPPAEVIRSYKDQVVAVVPFWPQGSGDFYAKEEELTDDQVRGHTKRAVNDLETARENIHVYSKRATQGAVVPCAYGFYRGCVQGIAEEPYMRAYTVGPSQLYSGSILPPQPVGFAPWGLTTTNQGHGEDQSFLG